MSKLQTELSTINEVTIGCISPLVGWFVTQRAEAEVRKCGESLKHKLESSLHSKTLYPVINTISPDYTILAMETALAGMVSDNLSSLRLESVEGVWQEVEAQLNLRLRLIQSLGAELAAAEDHRSEKVSFCGVKLEILGKP